MEGRPLFFDPVKNAPIGRLFDNVRREDCFLVVSEVFAMAKSAAQQAATAIHEKESAGKKSPAKKAAKKAAKKTAAKKGASSRKSVSLPKSGKDPKGGLTAEGRRVYNEATGGHLQAGVKGEPKNAEEKKRKGSFLTRHFTTPPGPVVKDGEPTRQALQAAAWGEAVPKTEADEKKLAAKGRKLLAEAKGEK